MDRHNRGRIPRIFITAFIILFIILVIMPFGVDKAMHLFIKGIAPGNDSIIVFKDLVSEKGAIARFIEIVKILTNFM